jgi:hypothetical protein
MKLFKNKGGVDWLKSLGLKSIHFTALGVENRPTPDITASVVEWMEREEAVIMGTKRK